MRHHRPTVIVSPFSYNIALFLSPYLQLCSGDIYTEKNCLESSDTVTTTIAGAIACFWGANREAQTPAVRSFLATPPQRLPIPVSTTTRSKIIHHEAHGRIDSGLAVLSESPKGKRAWSPRCVCYLKERKGSKKKTRYERSRYYTLLHLSFFFQSFLFFTFFWFDERNCLIHWKAFSCRRGVNRTQNSCHWKLGCCGRESFPPPAVYGICSCLFSL